MIIRESPEDRLAGHIDAARNYVEQGAMDEAVIEFKNAIQLDPQNARLRWELGQVYLSAGNAAAAAKEIEKAQELGLANRETTQALMRAAAERGDYQTALSSIAHLDASDQDSADVLAVQGDAALASGEIDAARERYQSALSRDEQDVNALLGLARISFDYGDTADARQRIDEVLAVDPDNAEALTLSGLLALQQPDREAAIGLFQHALRIDPAKLIAQTNLAGALIASQRFGEASEILTKLDQIASGNPLTTFMRGQIAYFENRLDEARAAFTEVLLAVPKHPQSLLLLSHVLYQQNDLLEAEKHASQFVAIAPEYLPGAQLLGAIHMRRGEPGKAVGVLRPVESQADENAGFLVLLGSALVASGQIDDGNRYLARARTMEPESAAFRTQQAIGQLAAGEIDQAITDLQGISSGDAPSSADYLLIYVHIQRGQFGEALRAANTLVSKQPENPSSYNLRGAVYVGQQEFAAARAEFERALAVDRSFVPALINLGRLDLTASKPQEARGRFEQALAVDDTSVNAYMALAALAVGERNTEQAIALLEKALEKSPAAVQPRLILAQHHLASGNVERALLLARDAAQYAPGDPQVRFLLGRTQLASNDVSAAKASFNELAVRYPEAVDVVLQLAAIASIEGERSETRRLIEQALSLNDNHPQALAALVRLDIADAEFDKARAGAKRLKDLYPDAVDGDLLIGDSYLAAGDHKAAIVAYQRIADAAAATPVTLRIFDAYRQAGDIEAARATLDDWLLKYPGDLAVKNARATLDLEQGDKGAAIAQYEMILRDAPENVIALNNLAFLYQGTDGKKALDYAARAYELAPDAYQVIDTYGWILVQQDKVERGLELLRKAVSLTADDYDVHYHYAAGLAKAGYRDEARDALQTLLRDDRPFSERRSAESLLALIE